jgi:hypothetical protein
LWLLLVVRLLLLLLLLSSEAINQATDRWNRWNSYPVIPSLLLLMGGWMRAAKSSL